MDNSTTRTCSVIYDLTYVFNFAIPLFTSTKYSFPTCWGMTNVNCFRWILLICLHVDSLGFNVKVVFYKRCVLYFNEWIVILAMPPIRSMLSTLIFLIFLMICSLIAENWIQLYLHFSGWLWWKCSLGRHKTGSEFPSLRSLNIWFDAYSCLCCTVRYNCPDAFFAVRSIGLKHDGASPFPFHWLLSDHQ
jgi:hypothetical protein